MRCGRARLVLAGVVVAACLGGPRAAVAADAPVGTEAQLRRAWADPGRTRIDLDADVVLRDCASLDPIWESPYPMLLDGHGHTLRQGCAEGRLLRQDGTGPLDLRRVTLTRGGSDGPGAAVTTRGELTLTDSVVRQNLAEEPGGGVFSMRRVLYTVGARSRGGYGFVDRQRRRRSHTALAFDLERTGLPALNLVAFPGEEPPQIECNEDAGGGDGDG